MYKCIQEMPEDVPDLAVIRSLEACRDHNKSLGCVTLALKRDEPCFL